MTELIGEALAALAAEGTVRVDPPADIHLERSRDPAHGDLASNVALALAGPAGMPPRDLARLICDALPDSPLVDRTEIAGPGFINFFLSADGRHSIVARVQQQGAAFGRSAEGANRPVQVEFVSANPTGPLHVGHGRGAAVGDCIARLLEATGWQVTREFYYNDAGRQIDNLAHSLQARCRGLEPGDPDWPGDAYGGDYLREVADAYLGNQLVEASDRQVRGEGDPEDLAAIREFAVAFLRREQDLDLQAFAVDFDVYFLESSLYDSGAVEATLNKLASAGHTFEEDGAVWLRSTDFGDDKDRVMRKSDGGYTYFLPDVAYHHNKWQRGFQRVINEQGADHHSTVTRVRAGLQALDVGIPEAWPEYVLHQMVTVMRGGEEVRISKRAGNYVSLRDLIDEVGRDATRYFLVARAPASQLTFDIDLALMQNNDNPVYYIQYAHARACSVFHKADSKGLEWDAEAGLQGLPLLIEEHESAIMKKLEQFPEVVSLAAQRLEPHRVAHCLRELAADFHSWYNAHQILLPNPALRNARLALVAAVRQVLVNGLDLLGVSAPESM